MIFHNVEEEVDSLNSLLLAHCLDNSNDSRNTVQVLKQELVLESMAVLNE